METIETTDGLSTRQDDLIVSAYDRLRPKIFGYIYKYVGIGTDADDLTQDVFLRLMECDYFIDGCTIEHFIFSIAHNLIIDWLRRHTRHIRACEYFFGRRVETGNYTDEAVAAKEITDMEMASVRSLSKRRIEIYSLCVNYGLSVREAANRLNLSRRTVENHLLRARNQVRASMREKLSAVAV